MEEESTLMVVEGHNVSLSGESSGFLVQTSVRYLKIREAPRGIWVFARYRQKGVKAANTSHDN